MSLAQAFLRSKLQGDLPPIVQIRHLARADLERLAQDLEEGAAGIGDERLVRRVVEQTRRQREHWIVSFREPDPAGTASTLHATMVRVYDDTGEAEFALT
jgi:hypothetical protein